jgi:hypothetical protein
LAISAVKVANPPRHKGSGKTEKDAVKSPPPWLHIAAIETEEKQLIKTTPNKINNIFFINFHLLSF